MAALAVFSVFGAGIYAVGGQVGNLWGQMLIPGAGLLFVLVYNVFFQRNYREFANVALFNVAQLLLDIAVVTVIIYYSGGVYSWFDAMFFLFVLEAALILPSVRQVWLIAAAAAAAYAAVLSFVLLRVLPRMPMPFVDSHLQLVTSYVAVHALWTMTVIFGAATVGTLFMRENRRRIDALVTMSVRDSRTGLFDRSFLRRELGAELGRAKRYVRGVSVVIADIDRFADFNRTFGVDAGNRMLETVARVVREVAADGGSGSCQATAARWGGEEFALVVAEDGQDPVLAESLAQHLRRAVGETRDEDRSVTVSVGVSAFPAGGLSTSELLSTAEAAAASAASLGGDRVVTATGASAAS